MTKPERDECRSLVRKLKDRAEELERSVERGPGESEVLQHIAACRAAVNELFAKATAGRTDPSGEEDRPAWKSAARKATGE